MYFAIFLRICYIFVNDQSFQHEIKATYVVKNNKKDLFFLLELLSSGLTVYTCSHTD